MIRGAARRWLAVAFVTAPLTGGCLAPNSLKCSDGRICPPGTTCDVANHTCVTQSEIAACIGHDGGDGCFLNQAPGVCRSGTCRPFYCGDGVRNGAEDCDDSDLNGETCATRGFYVQTTGLACNDDCTFKTSGCEGACGDGVRNGTEACDRDDLGGADCKTAGFYEAPGLVCSPFCAFDRGACRGFCGDGITNGPETCDGDDLGGADCKAAGFYEGPGLACSQLCTWDSSACTGWCGDRVVNGDELCDGAPPGNQTCMTYGFDRGFFGCSALCNPLFDGCAAVGWRTLPSAAAGVLSGVWGAGPSDVFAVGSSTIVHWDGVRWTEMVPPSSNLPDSLFSVWGTGSRDVFAVGASTAWHWDGVAWSPMLPGPQGNFVAVWGSSSTDVYAVGWTDVGIAVSLSGPVAAHWDGMTWSEIQVPYDLVTAEGLNGVWGSGPNDVFMVGFGVAVHWDGTVWSKIPVPGRLSAVWGSGPGDVFVVGQLGNVWHWDGRSWTLMDSGTDDWLEAVWGTGPDDVFAVSADPAGRPRLIVHWDGTSWSKVYSDDALAAGRTGTVGIWGSGRDDVFVVGASDTFLHGDGTSWFVTSGNATLSGVWASGADHAVAVGFDPLAGADGDDVVLEWKGTTQSTKTTTGDPGQPAPRLDAVWVGGPDRMFVGDSQGKVYYWDGAAFYPTTACCARDIWGSGPDFVFLVGDNGMSFWDGRVWQTAFSDSDSDSAFNGVWGIGPDNVYAVGMGGAIRHWDGKSASPMSSGSTKDLNDVWGSGPNDIYAVGAVGTILHFDGTRWSKIASGTTDRLLSVAGTGPADVFVAGSNTLLHSRGGIGIWERIALPAPMTGMWATPSRVFFVGGKNFFYLDRNTVTCKGPERYCHDGWDNDCDGVLDGGDPDCAGRIAEQCANLVDDDGDGKTDCSDSDCANFPSCKGRR